MSFAKLKRNRDQINKLVNAAEVASGNKKYGDDRFWKPTVDKAGNGYAVIRFLPAPEGCDVPWVQYWDHGFQGPTGQWYIEKSLTSIGKDDPVSEYNSKLWNSGGEGSPEREQARKQKRRLHYVSNILVIHDSSNPDNDGKVFLYQYGKKIFDKIMDVMRPQFDDEEPINPFDFWEGANFKLKIRQVEGYRNYDKSEFEKKSVLDDDDNLEVLYKQLHDISEFVDPSKYKSYDELKEKFNRIMGLSSVQSIQDEVKLENTESAPIMKELEEPELAVSNDLDVEDDDLKFFSALAEED